MAEGGGSGRAVITSLTGLLGVAGTLLGGYAAYNSQQTQAKLAAQQVTIGEQTAKLEEIKANRDYELRVFERVATALEKRDNNQLTASTLLVKSLPDSSTIKGELLVILLTAGQSLSKSGEAVPSEILDLKEQQFEQGAVAKASEIAPAPSAAAPDKAAAPAPAAPARAVEYVKNANPSGWDIDVFWCSEGDQASRNKSAAEAAAARLAQASKSGEKIAGEVLGRVRLNALSAAQNAKGGFGVKGDLIHANSDELAIAETMAPMLGGPAVQKVSFKTPWYLSVFYCAGAA